MEKLIQAYVECGLPNVQHLLSNERADSCTDIDHMNLRSLCAH